VLLTNSKNTAARIKKFYNRDATVLYPPCVLSNPSHPSNPHNPSPTHSIETTQPYFLCVGRLVKYKNFDLAVAACSKLNLTLKVIGEGPELENLKKIAGPTVEFLGRVSDSQLADYSYKCQAVLFPTKDEDFGMVIVEALSYGKPVVALRGGGASEIIEEKVTGEFFEEATIDSLCAVLTKFDATKYDLEACKTRATFFNGSDFKEKILEIISGNWDKNKSPVPQP
jgi:glycosyltransferase involved in cell wall biosynthesis